jgi:hypothetical protein
MDDESTYAISATLRVQTNHVQMWVADDAEVDKAALARSAAVLTAISIPPIASCSAPNGRPASTAIRT